MAEIKSRESLEDWLNGRPEKTRQVEAVAIAGRAALRVLPLLSQSTERIVRLPANDLHDRLMLVSFRCAAASRSFVLTPIRSVAYAAFRADAAATRVDAIAMHTDAHQAAYGVARSAGRAARSAARAADAASRAAESTSYAADAAFAAYGASRAVLAAAIWASVKCDTESFDTKVTASSLINFDLWLDSEKAHEAISIKTGRTPRWASSYWRDLHQYLLSVGHQWEVWIEWYEAILDNQHFCWDLPRSRADAIMAEALRWDEAEWEKGPAHVNQQIRGLIEAAKHEPSESPDIDDSPANKQNTPPLPQGLPQEFASKDSATSRDFFVSYATPDEAMAREVSAVLEEAGHNTFAQFRDMPTGSNFVTEMQRGLGRTSRVVALYSPRYVASHQCQAEWNAAYNADPSGAQRKLVPFLIEATELPPLARQVVFKSLVGLNRAARKKAILEAIEPRVERSPQQIRAALARVASPKAVVRDGRLGVEPNPVVDAPLTKGDIDGLPQSQIALVKVILDSLPPNAPPSVRGGLSGYARHLTEHGLRPNMRHLNTLCGGVEDEYRAMGLEEWGKGLERFFSDFFRDHALLRTHYPRAEEQVYKDLPVNEDAARGDDLTRPLAQVDAATKAAADAGQVLPDLAETVAQTAEVSKSIEHLKPDPLASQPGSTRMSLKRRFVLGALAFMISFHNVLGSTASITSTPTGAALYKALGDAIEKFTAFIK